MKYLLIAVFSLFSLMAYSQDSTTVANTELLRIANRMSFLESSVNILEKKVLTYEELTRQFKSQLTSYKELKTEDDSLISVMHTEIKLRTNLYTEMMSSAYKPKNNTLEQVVWFAGGLAVAFIGVSLATKL